MNQIDVILGNDYLVLSQLFKNYVCMEGLYKFVFLVWLVGSSIYLKYYSPWNH